MSILKIPQSIKEIFDEYIKSNFRRFSYKYLADRLGLKVDTIIQRISRNKEFFEIDDSERPSRISIRKGIKEIYFYRDKNQCHLCQKIVDPEKLFLKHRNPYQDDKFDWKNVLSVCGECKEKIIIKKVKLVKKPGTVEYKEVYIRLVSKMKGRKSFYYYEFDEHDGTGEFPLLDENNNIASETVGDVLNYFGSDGWEVVYVHVLRGEYDDAGYEDFQVFFKRKRTEEID